MSLRQVYQLLAKQLLINRYLQYSLLLLLLLVLISITIIMKFSLVLFLLLMVMVVLIVRYYTREGPRIRPRKAPHSMQKLPYSLLFSLGSHDVKKLMQLSGYAIVDTMLINKEAEPISVWSNGSELILVIDTQTKDKRDVLIDLQDWSRGPFWNRNKPQAIVMTLNLTELLLLSENELKQALAEQREWMAQSGAQFGYLLPINLVVNELCTLAGYEQFVRRLDDRNVLYGLSLLMSRQHQLIEIYSDWHDKVYVQLTALRVNLLSLENDPKKRLSIYDFPEQFYAIKSRVLLLLQVLSKPYLEHEPLNLYSLQFLSTSKRKIIINNQSRQGDPSFTSNATHDVVVTVQDNHFDSDKFLAIIHDSHSEKQPTVDHKKRQLIVLSLLATLCLLSTMAVTTVFSHNYNAIVAKLQTIKTNTSQLVSALSSNDIIDNKVESLVAAFDGYHHEAETIKTINHWFLLPGLQRIERYYRLLINKTLEQLFFQPTQATLVEKLQYSSRQWSKASVISKESLREQFYQKLAAYMILSFKRSQDIDKITPYLAKLWADELNQQSVTGNHYLSSRLIPLVSFYLQGAGDKRSNVRMSLPIQPNLVRRVRQQLHTQASLKNQYAYLLATAKSNWPVVSLTTLLKVPVAEADQTITFPSAFTQTAWRSSIKPSINKVSQLIDSVNWVLNMPMTILATHSKVDRPRSNNQLLADYQKQLRQLYFDDYRAAWLTLLENVHLERYHTIKQAQRSLRSITAGDNELNRLFHKSLSNIAFADISESISKTRQVAIALKLFAAYKKDLVQLDHQLTAINGVEQQSVSLKKLSKLIASNIDKLNLRLTHIKQGSLRHAMQTLLLQPYQQVYRVLLTRQRKKLQDRWQPIYDEFQRNISSQLPFTLNRHKLSVESFNDFFQPGAGVFWTFFDKQLQPYLLYQDNDWVQKQWLGLSIGFSTQLMTAVQQLATMRKALFSDNKITVDFDVYPEAIRGVDEVLLVINKQRLKFSNGPQVWQQFHWQPTSNNANTLLRVEHRDHQQAVIFHSDDAWGLLALLQKANIKKLNARTYQVRWKNQAMLLFRFTKSDNIINLIQAKKLQLPESLFL